MDVSRACAEEYRSHGAHLSTLRKASAHHMQNLSGKARPPTDGISSLLPLHHTKTPIRPSVTHNSGSTQSGADPIQSIPPSQTDVGLPGQRQGHDTELYWCVNGPWKDAKDLMVSKFKVSTTSEDSDFFQSLKNSYTGIRGGFQHFFSWKSCEDVEFIEVRCMQTQNLKIRSQG